MLVLVAGYVGYLWVFADGPVTALRVVEATGQVTRAGLTGPVHALETGDTVGTNQTVTVGENSRAVLAVGDGTQIELAARSAIRVVDISATGLRVEMEHGRVSARVRAGSTPLSVSSRGRAIYANNADFTVAVDDDGALVLDPDRGSVVVDGFGAEDKQVGEGTRLSSLPGHDAVLGRVPVEFLLKVGVPGASSTRQADVLVEGQTGSFAAVRIGREGSWTQVRAGPDGHFKASVPLDEGPNQLQVQARDVLGNTRQDELTVTRDSTAPVISGSQVQWGP